jgi:hypothetical protein
MVKDLGAIPGYREPNPQAVSALPGFDPGRGCTDCGGELPMYGVAPHECYWRKGPQFTLGQSTLVPFDESACFVPDLEPGETWADFRYPAACGVYYCPRCNADQYRAAWSALVARIGQPPAEIAHTHGAHA